MSNFVTVLGAFGILFGVYQYTQQLEAERASRTLEMIETWRAEGYREDFVALRSSVQALLDAIPPEDLALAEQSGRASENLRRRILSRVMADPQTEPRFANTIYYFNLLGLCVEANLCSTSTARIFFDDTLSGFLQVFEPEIQARQTALPGFAEGVLLLRDRLQ